MIIVVSVTAMSTTPSLPLALLANRLFKASEADFFEALAAAGHAEIRMRHTALFEALDETGTRASVLAERLGMTPQAVGQLLDEAEANGYVMRTQDAGDRRARVVTLTDRGRETVQMCYELLSRIELDYARLLGVDDEYAAVKRGLTELLDALAARPIAR